MNRLTIGWEMILLKTILILAIIAVGGTFYFFDGLQQPINSQTIILDHHQEIPLAEAPLRIVMPETEDNLAVEGLVTDMNQWPEQAVMLSFLAGQTDDYCNSQPVTFSLPADIAIDQPLSLVVQTEHPTSRPAIEPADQTLPPVKVLLTTDQPTYQPGQTIRLWALVLNQPDQKPATDLTINFLVTDPQGDHFWQETSVTSKFGIASGDFKLPAMVHQGYYTLRLQVVDKATSPTTESVILTEVEQVIEVQADMPAHAG